MAAPILANARVVDAKTSTLQCARCKNFKTKTVESITGVPHSAQSPSRASIVLPATQHTTQHSDNNEMTSSSIYIYITQAINLSKLHLDVIGALYKCKRQCNDLLSVCTSGAENETLLHTFVAPVECVN